MAKRVKRKDTKITKKVINKTKSTSKTKTGREVEVVSKVTKKVKK